MHLLHCHGTVGARRPGTLCGYPVAPPPRTLLLRRLGTHTQRVPGVPVPYCWEFASGMPKRLALGFDVGCERGPPRMPVGDALVGVAGAQQVGLVEGPADELKPDW